MPFFRNFNIINFFQGPENRIMSINITVMKTRKVLLVLLCAFIYPISDAQDISKDTTMANQYFARAVRFENNSSYDSAKVNAIKAQVLYIRYFGEKSVRNANVLHQLGRLYWREADYERALDCNLKALQIRKELLGENHPDVARSLNNLGIVYSETGEYEKSLDYHFRTLEPRKKLLGENHPDIALIYDNIGGVYQNMGNFDKAREFFEKALQLNLIVTGEKSQAVITSYRNLAGLYYSMSNLSKALEYNLKILMLREEIYGQKHPLIAASCNSVGTIYCDKGEYDTAIEYFRRALQIVESVLGSNHVETASAYNNIALVYVRTGDYDKALKYFEMALDIYKTSDAVNNAALAGVYGNIGVVLYEKGDYEKSLGNLFMSVNILKAAMGESDSDIAGNYLNIGNVYMMKGDYGKAIDFISRAVQIKIKLSGEQNPEIASAYNNIGIAYMNKGEFVQALDYYLMSLQIRKVIYGENHPFVAQSYNNIGNIYSGRADYSRALEYHNLALKADISILGAGHPDVASCYGNIGLDYYGEHDFVKALEYYFRALQIQKSIYGENHSIVATSYNNIGNAYDERNMTDSALAYHTRALTLRIKLLGEKHPYTASSCNNIGYVYRKQGKFDLALYYFQKGEIYCTAGPSDTSSLYSIPVVKNSLDWSCMLQSFMAQAQIIGDRNIVLKGISPRDRKRVALAHYMACDSLIDITRRKINSLQDKLALGEISSKVYVNAIDFLTDKGTENISSADSKMAFYFSEKNKSSVLLEALAGQEAQKYAGIPDSLLQKEYTLKTDIAFYTRLMAGSENLDSTLTANYQREMFRSTRSYDSLISIFEKQFPEYYSLKYNIRVPAVKEIQKLLGAGTALVSYVLGDSSITVFNITRKRFDIKKVPEIANLDDSIRWFRYGLTKSSPRMQNAYRRLGFTLFGQLFPGFSGLSKHITDLVIIPDGRIATLPFEALLTENPEGNIDSYSLYPYLIRNYNISYSYSANLFCRTVSQEASRGIEITKLNDWLAFAPVFDDRREESSFMASRELKRQMEWYQSDSLMASRSLFERSYITPLPATETETETIFTFMDERNLKAKVMLRSNATESAVKSADSQNYRMIHFATHGFVNSEKPELSGLLLAADSAGKEDGILYSGEIYNLNLNTDLVVLSACETGLGKIQKGEGIIGLTRALLYAGARNIVVSLWQVADESTSKLMVDFYRNCLENKGQGNYSAAIRDAKLKMISEVTFAHPYFWSPFILIGR